MFRQSKKRALARTNFGEEVARSAEYPYRLNIYRVPPLQEITLEELETWAIDRLKLLNSMEQALAKNLTVKDMESFLKPAISKFMPLSRTGSVVASERKKDHYSHFTLRLAFCRTQELRSKFVRLETALFRLRYATDDTADRLAFIRSLNLDWEAVEPQEYAELAPALAAGTNPAPGPDETFFKVDFERVPDLIEQRRVFLKAGKAYVPMSLQQSLVLAEFSSNLERQLEMTARALPRLDEDDRLMPILTNLSSGLSSWSPINGPSYSSDITAETVDQLDREGHFPLCMHHMHNQIKINHHAQYTTRQQYGLFLKGIGLSADEAVKFWRMSFSKFTDDQFSKEYQYNILHNYGLKGSRKDYQPSDCLTIVNSSGNGSDCHGCPYRKFNDDQLVSSLKELGIADSKTIGDVKALREQKQYHLACSKVYEAKHPFDETIYAETITHPNTYFERSYKAGKEHHTAQPPAQGAPSAQPTPARAIAAES